MRSRSNLKHVFAILGIVVFMMTGFTWPWDEEQAKKNNASGSNVPATRNNSGDKSTEDLEGSAKSQDKQIQVLKEQIDKILQLNEVVKDQSQQRAVEMQRMIEQARIHQQILHTLEVGKSGASYRSNDASKLLEQEKIRLIQEQTLQSLSALQNFKSGPVLSNSQTVESVQRINQVQETQETLRIVEQPKNRT